MKCFDLSRAMIAEDHGVVACTETTMRCFVGFKEEEGCHEFEATRDVMRESKKSGVCKQAAAKQLRRKERSGV